jgi:O-antigen ligase
MMRANQRGGTATAYAMRAAPSGQVKRGARSRRPQEAEVPSPPLIVVGCAVVFLLALFLGGGTRQGLWSDAIVQLASLPLLGVLLWKVPQLWRRKNSRLAVTVVAALALLPLFQLIPLPPAIWAALSGRATIASTFNVAGIAKPWLGISLNPGATLRAFLTLLPAVAVFLAVLFLNRRSRRHFVFAFVAFAFISVVLGLAQLTQGPDSPLQFYTLSSPSEAEGFFANRNHFAALLYSAVPFTAAYAVSLAADRRREMIVGLVLCLLVFASLLLGLGMSRSRAGLALAMVAGIGSLVIAVSGSRMEMRKRASRLIYLGGFAGVVLILQFALVGILQRLNADPVDDQRWEFASVTMKAARNFLPFGSGFGTFEDIYKLYEAPNQLDAQYVNHAHNEYLEALLEGGIPAALILFGFLVWFGTASYRCWRSPRADSSLSTLDRCLPRAATLVVLLLLLHSGVDYPLRTTAVSTLFAFACGLMFAPLRPPASLPNEKALKDPPPGGDRFNQ